MLNDISAYLAILGLCLAAMELYLPNLSRRIESGFDATIHFLSTALEVTRKAPADLQERVSDSILGRYLSKYHKLVCIIYTLAVVVSVGVSFSSDQVFETLPRWWEYGSFVIFGTIFLLLLSVSILSYSIDISLSIWSGVCKFLSFLIWLAKAPLSFANWIGKGKGLSGIGLLLAVGDVTERTPYILQSLQRLID